MGREEFSGKFITIGISDVATASVHYEKTGVKKLIGRAKRDTPLII